MSTELCLSYTRKASVNDCDIGLTIGISYKHLRSWYDWKKSGTLGENSFNEILNPFISQHGIQLIESERINGLLRRSILFCLLSYGNPLHKVLHVPNF